MNTIPKKIIYLTCFGLSVLILAAVEFCGIMHSQKLADNSSLTKHTYIVLQSNEKLLSKLTDAGTGIRGYFLTHDKKFLEPYNSAVKEIPLEYNNLKELTADNYIQQQYLDTLGTLINIRLSLLSPYLEMKSMNSDSALRHSIVMGKITLDNIKRITGAMENEENTLLLSRINNEAESTWYINISQVAGSAISIAIMLIMLILLYLENKKRIEYEQKLTETKNFLELTLDNIGESVISTDKFSNIIYMNAPAEKFLGWDFEEARSKKFNDVVNIVDSNTLTKIDNLVSRVLVEKNIPWENSKFVVNRAGKNIFIDNSAASLTDEDGNVDGAVLVLRDISESKIAQDKIEESRALATSTLNSLNAHIALLDGNGVINSVNKSWAAFALLNEDVRKLNVGTNYIEVCEKSTGENSVEAKKFAEGIKSVLNGAAEEFLTEYPFYSYSGERWFKGKVTKFIGKGPNKVVVTLEDITYKKEIEGQVRKNEEKFRSMVQNSSDIISMLSADGSIMYVSQASRNILGYDRSNRLGKNIFDYVHPDDLPKVKATFNMLLKAPGLVITQELKYRNVEDKYINLEIVFNNLLDDPNVKAIVLNSRDITDRKKAEERLISALNEKELLLKEIHHRVKNNLQIISSLLKLQSNHFSNDNLKAAFDESISRVRSMALVHQKLYQTDNSVSVNFDEYLNNFISYLFQTYGAAKSRIMANISSDDINMSVDDAIPCGLIINELVTNSFKYGFPDGRTGKITVGLTYNENAGEYNLIVGDDGVGLPEEIDLSNTNTSFGFQLVSTLVDQMDGKIEIVRNNGTMFKITLKSSKYKKRQ